MHVGGGDVYGNSKTYFILDDMAAIQWLLFHRRLR